MAFTQFNYDMDIISKLSDSPNVDDGLTAAQLKGKFDEAGKVIKNYINSTLLVEALEKPDFQGMVKSNGTGFIAAEAGKDYQAPLGTGDVTKEMLAGDVLSKILSGVASVELAADKWASNTQTVDVEGVKAGSHLVVSASPDSFVVWCESQIRAVSHEEGKVTFKCEDAPAEAVSASILIVG